MRSTHIALLSAVAVVSLYAGTVSADDRLHITPPLYRDLARATQQIHRAAELTTTPHPVAPAQLDGDTSKIAAELVASAR